MAVFLRQVVNAVKVSTLPKTFYARQCVQQVRNLVTESRPPLPKRPLSAYMRFMVVKRPDIIQANPGLPITDQARAAGELWRNLPEGEKKVYKDAAHSEMEDYKRAYEQLTPEQKEAYRAHTKLKTQQRARRKRKALEKKLHKPKSGPVSAFSCFMKAGTHERGSALPKDYLQGLAQTWRKMPEEDKLEYVDQAKENRLAYQEALAKWEAEMTELGHEELVRGYKTQQRLKAKKPARKRAKKAKKTTKRKTTRRTATKAKKTKATQTTTTGRKTKATQTEE